MRLLRYGHPGEEKPGILDANNHIRDVSTYVDDWANHCLSDETFNTIGELDINSLPIVESRKNTPRIGPCVGQVGKFICIGLNYFDHAKESGMELPQEPVVFFKATSAICGPNDGIEIPRGSQKTDWEVELGVVIGKMAKYVNVEEALDYVAGFCLVNDLSERDFQLHRCGQWVKGKSADTFGPIGPWLVTRDEIPDPQNLSMSLQVNGKIFQQGSTQNMHFDIATIISHLSQFMSLHPGDIISTGTPLGVGMGQKPEVYLKQGDRVELTIEHLGIQKQIVRQSK